MQVGNAATPLRGAMERGAVASRGPAGDVSRTSAHMAPKLLSSPEVPGHVLHFYVNRAARGALPFVGAGCTEPPFHDGPVSWH